MIQTEKRTINGREWQCTQWAGTKNFAMLFELARVATPTFAHGVKPGSNILSAEVNLGGAVDALMGQLGSSEHVQGLILRLLDGVHIDGRNVTKAEFDVAFVGPKLFDLVPGLKFVLETNFGDFSSLLAGIMNLSVVQQLKEPSVEESKEDSSQSSPAN